MRLLALNANETIDLLNSMKHESKALIESIYEMSEYSKNISREEAWAMSVGERKVLEKIIKDKIKIMEKSKINLF